MFNAYVTVGPDGKLAAGSVVTVEHIDGSVLAWAEVPQKANVGGVLFWHRVNQALGEVGWRIVRSSADNHERDGAVIRFHAEKI